MAKINIEFDVLGDCSDKVIVYVMDNDPKDSPLLITDRFKTHLNNVKIIQNVCKPKAIIKIIESDYIKAMDSKSAITLIDSLINELNNTKEQLLKKDEDDKNG